ncbi:hypothetical protein SVI_3162 [Shewanella violacea DSS12]|uniref:Uncharacterized protein n=1 Tax=Shewanella violacea (strain JCM 10179 / CIP 106290 / LMG 19151 / DSS12) TaxID=637905 RepID=D4ZAT8_SHEVD|nr:hypothetical protein SVI_3162 [Shewanella violacea DSS12]
MMITQSINRLTKTIVKVDECDQKVNVEKTTKTAESENICT